MSHLNPYVNGGVIRNDEQFYDRNQLVEELISKTSNAYYIKGKRRIGKTSLLRSIERRLLSSEGYLPVYLDLEGGENIDDMARYFQRALKSAAANKALSIPKEILLEDFIEGIIKGIQFALNHQLHFYLLLDEAEQLLKLEDRHLAKLHREFVNSHNNLTVVMTATRKLQEFFHRRIGNASFLDNFSTLHLGYLPSADAADLLRQTKLPSTRRPLMEEALLRNVIYLTGGHPFFLQRLGYQLFDKGKLRDLNENDLTIDGELDHYIEVDFDHLSETQQQVLLQFNWREVINKSEIEASLGFDPQSELVELDKLGFLTSDEQYYRLSNYFLGQWLERRKRQKDIEEEEVKTPLIFLSYSHRDDEWRVKLRIHLKILETAGRVKIWEDTHLRPGEKWNDEIERQLELADIFLFLVSADLLASDYVRNKELPKALSRFEAGEAKVVPIIMRDCLWQASDFSKFQVLPKDGKPVKSAPDEDEVLAQIVKKINELVENA